MKKFLSIALIAILCFTFASCSSPKVANTVFSKADLEGKKIGVQLGTTGDIYSSDYEKKGSTVERYSKGADAVSALKQGKIDCVIIDQQPAKVFVDKNDDLKILEEPFELEEYAITVSKEKKELKDAVNATLIKLKEDGTVAKIIDNYIGTDVGKNPYTSPANADRSKGKLIMATSAEFPPYEYYGNDQKIIGIDADIAQAICDSLGYELKIEDMAFDSIITSVQTGKADIGIAGMTITPDRLKNIDFTVPYTTATQVIIVRK